MKSWNHFHRSPLYLFQVCLLSKDFYKSAEHFWLQTQQRIFDTVLHFHCNFCKVSYTFPLQIKFFTSVSPSLYLHFFFFHVTRHFEVLLFGTWKINNTNNLIDILLAMYFTFWDNLWKQALYTLPKSSSTNEKCHF